METGDRTAHHGSQALVEHIDHFGAHADHEERLRQPRNVQLVAPSPRSRVLLLHLDGSV